MPSYTRSCLRNQYCNEIIQPWAKLMEIMTKYATLM